jgi:hypothetical protein
MASSIFFVLNGVILLALFCSVASGAALADLHAAKVTVRHDTRGSACNPRSPNHGRKWERQFIFLRIF